MTGRDANDISPVGGAGDGPEPGPSAPEESDGLGYQPRSFRTLFAGVRDFRQEFTLYCDRLEPGTAVIVRRHKTPIGAFVAFADFVLLDGIKSAHTPEALVAVLERSDDRGVPLVEARLVKSLRLALADRHRHGVLLIDQPGTDVALSARTGQATVLHFGELRISEGCRLVAGHLTVGADGQTLSGEFELEGPPAALRFLLSNEQRVESFSAADGIYGFRRFALTSAIDLALTRLQVVSPTPP